MSANSTPHPDARDTPRHWQSSQPRAGGRERWVAKSERA